MSWKKFPKKERCLIICVIFNYIVKYEDCLANSNLKIRVVTFMLRAVEDLPIFGVYRMRMRSSILRWKM